MFRWISAFLLNKSIQIRAGTHFSGKYVVENGTPQGSIINPLLFSIMINDVFNKSGSEMGFSCSADDWGYLAKRTELVIYGKEITRTYFKNRRLVSSFLLTKQR